NIIRSFANYGPFNDPWDVRPKHLAQIGDEVFFVADDGISGLQIWATDGNSVRQLSNLASTPTRLVAAGNQLYFTADEAGAGRELWESDGSTAGTRQAVDLYPGPDASDPEHLTALGDGRVAFLADDGASGVEIFVYDSISRTAELVFDVGPGDLDGFRRHTFGSPIKPVGMDHLAFTPEDASIGYELWISNGRPAGTTSYDLFPGPGSSGPGSFRNIVMAGGRAALWFSATHPTLGREAWVFPLEDLGIPGSEEIGQACSAAGVAEATTGIVGLPRIGESIEITLENDPRGLNFGVLAFSSEIEALGFESCWPIVGGSIRTELMLIEDGRASRVFDIPTTPELIGQRFYFQHALLQFGGPFLSVFDLSSGLAVVVGG
ncbi:MAG: hypothetical protein ACYTG5_16640, partial [Planctomycetota bacterium]